VQAHPGVLGWLFTTVRRACLRLLRPFVRERRYLGDRVDLDGARPEPSLSAEASLDRYRLVCAVHAAIANIPKRYREVLILRDLEGMAGEEVARRLGVSLAAMKTRLPRARDLVRQELNGKYTWQ
jgi:RNA polymerase sigma-70 factor (ECF subfamily)